MSTGVRIFFIRKQNTGLGFGSVAEHMLSMSEVSALIPSIRKGREGKEGKNKRGREGLKGREERLKKKRE